ncbi:MAG: TIGR00730 family Rossman fold protein [Paludibacter sp.]|jgi:uncharacterized protein (TIGR00730 family)|nr:TIGR00730 family Rossman fold protein [Paludibacter sp.]
MTKICVYCASSTKIADVYFEAAEQLGKIFVENNIQLVYGAGKMGLMGKIADTMLARGGKVTGVIPQFMCAENWHHPDLSELIITETMHERKKMMTELADAAVALPGGVGTMEELLEIITWKQLGLFPKAIVILNVNNYYSHLLAALQNAVNENFMRPIHSQIWHTVDNPDQVLPSIGNMPIWDNTVRKFAAT